MLSRNHKLDAVIVTAMSDYVQATTQDSSIPNSDPNPLGIEPAHMEFIQPAGLQVMLENSTLQVFDSEGLAVNDSIRRCDSGTYISNEENNTRDSSHDRIEMLHQLIDIKVRVADIVTHIS
jgi:ribosome assembly protein YihI (activator of Der GTPase)